MKLREELDLQATSDGAKKAWETRRASEEGSKEVKDSFKPRKSLKEIHQVLTEAGRNNQTVLLTYHKEDSDKPKRYSVEPYSYRGDKFFAYDLDAKSIKGFKLLRITDAAVQDTKFKPRWPVELKGSAIGLV